MKSALDKKEWKKSNGETRWYINNWKELIGLTVEYHNTGNVSYVELAGQEISNNRYKKYISGTKVWLDDDEEIHIDYCQDGTVRTLIREAVEKAISEEVIE